MATGESYVRIYMQYKQIWMSECYVKQSKSINFIVRLHVFSEMST